MLSSKLPHWLLPFTCVLCHRPGHADLDLCEACYHELPWISGACENCALPIPEGKICGECIKNPHSYQSILALWLYKQPIDHFITNLKFQNQLLFSRLLGTLLFQKVKTTYQDKPLPTCIIPVPLHRSRLKERGFNQALEIARPLSKNFKIAIDTTHCTRIKATAAQSSLLSLHERRRNIKNAFHINPLFQAKHVAIVDDVVTTGHTVDELSKALTLIGVEKIDIWCCAKTELFTTYSV